MKLGWSEIFARKYGMAPLGRKKGDAGNAGGQTEQDEQRGDLAGHMVEDAGAGSPRG